MSKFFAEDGEGSKLIYNLLVHPLAIFILLAFIADDILLSDSTYTCVYYIEPIQESIVGGKIAVHKALALEK